MKCILFAFILLFFTIINVLQANDDIHFNNITLTKQVYEHYIKVSDPNYLPWSDFRNQLVGVIDSHNALTYAQLIPRLEHYQQLPQNHEELHINQIMITPEIITNILNQDASVRSTDNNALDISNQLWGQHLINLNIIDNIHDITQHNAIILLLRYLQLQTASSDIKTYIFHNILINEIYNNLLILSDCIRQMLMQSNKKIEIANYNEVIIELIIIFHETYQKVNKHSPNIIDIRINNFYTLISLLNPFAIRYESQREDEKLKIEVLIKNSLKFFYIIQNIERHGSANIQSIQIIKKIFANFAHIMNTELIQSTNQRQPSLEGQMYRQYIESFLALIQDMLASMTENYRDILQLTNEFDRLFFHEGTINIYNSDSIIAYDDVVSLCEDSTLINDRNIIDNSARNDTNEFDALNAVDELEQLERRELLLFDSFSLGNDKSLQ